MTDGLETVASWGSVTGYSDPEYKLATAKFGDDWLVLLLRKQAMSYDVVDSWHVEDEPETPEVEEAAVPGEIERGRMKSYDDPVTPCVRPRRRPKDIVEGKFDD